MLVGVMFVIKLLGSCTFYTPTLHDKYVPISVVLFLS